MDSCDIKLNRKEHENMKKQLIAILLVLTIAACIFPLSAFAESEDQAPFNTALSNSGIAPLATNSAPPSDFHFVYQISGNTSVDTTISNITLATVSFAMGYVPGGAVVAFTIAIAKELLELYSMSPTLQGDYIKYVYRPDDPFLYPAVDSWVRIAYYADANQDGVKEYIGEYCYYETIVLPKSADMAS